MRYFPEVDEVRRRLGGVMGANPGSVLGLVNVVAVLSAVLVALVVWFKLYRTRRERISAQQQEALLAAWESRSPERIREVITALPSRPIHRLSDLTSALKRSDSDVTWDPELTTLARDALNDAGVDELLRTFLRSKSPVRRGIAVMLGGFPPTALSPRELGRFLADPDSTIRLAASASLGRIATPEAAEELITGLNRGDLPDARIVERLGRSWAVPTILAALDSDELTAHVRAQLFRALALTGDLRGAAVAFLAVEEVGEEEQIQALRLLLACADGMDIADRERLATCAVRSLKSGNPTVRSLATQLLAVVGHPDRESLLAELVQDPDWFVRRSAARALATCGRSGIDKLRVLADGPDEFASHRAQEELRRMEMIARKEWKA